MTARRTGTAVERWQELADVKNLIEAHRAASIAWAYAFDAEERKALEDDAGATADLVEATRRERDALDRLLRWRPSTLRGEAERLRYLFCDPVGAWREAVPAPAEVDLLIASMEGA